MASKPVNELAHFVHNNTTAPAHPSLLGMFSLKGKTAIVTGAGAGIGLAVAQGLAEAGANVAMLWNTNDKCPQRASEVASQYGVQSTFQFLNFCAFLITFLLIKRALTTNSQGLSGRHHKCRGRAEDCRPGREGLQRPPGRVYSQRRYPMDQRPYGRRPPRPLFERR